MQELLFSDLYNIKHAQYDQPEPVAGPVRHLLVKKLHSSHAAVSVSGLINKG